MIPDPCSAARERSALGVAAAVGGLLDPIVRAVSYFGRASMLAYRRRKNSWTLGQTWDRTSTHWPSRIEMLHRDPGIAEQGSREPLARAVDMRRKKASLEMAFLIDFGGGAEDQPALFAVHAGELLGEEA